MAEESPEDHISRIRADCGVGHDGTIVQNRIFRICERSLSTLSTELNKDPAHFLLEIIQNADDLKYAQGVEPLLSFQVLENHLLITSNETGFTPKDVNAICSVAESTKIDSADSTGEKGIGFKSIFKAATGVWISSNGYKFKFDSNEPCGIVIPAWTSFPPEFAHLMQPRKTQFLLQFKSSSKEKVLQDIQCLDPKILVFLRKLREIDVLIDGNKKHIRRQDSEKYNGLSINLSTTLTHGDPTHENPTHEGPTSYEFICTRKQIPVTVQNPKRKGRVHTEVILAFPVDNGLVGTMSAAIQVAGKAYNYLPICRTNFPFLFQADFILSSTREDVDDAHEEWNTMLLKGLARAFLDAVERFNNTDELRYCWISYLPLSPGHDSFSELSKYIKAELFGKQILFSSLNPETLLKAGGAYFVPIKFRDHKGQPLLANNLNLSVSYTGVEGLTYLGVTELSTTQFLELLKIYMGSPNGEREFRGQRPEWQLKLAQALLEVNVDEIRDLALIPLRNEKWSASPNEHKIYFSQSDITTSSLKSIPLELKSVPPGLDRILIVRDGVALSGTSCRKLFSNLGVTTLGVQEICKEICKLHSSRETSPSQDMQTLIFHAKYLFDAYRAKIILGTPKNLWVCNMDGIPYLGGEMYQSETQVESLVKTYVVGTTSERNFLHPNYMLSLPKVDHKAWSTWLSSSVGVNKTLRITNIRSCWHNDPKPTPEFLRCMNTIPDPQEFLKLLVDICSANLTSPAFASRPSFPFLRSMSRPWSGKDCVRLDHTILPSPELTKRAPNGVSFIGLRNPEDSKWNRLANFGVTIKEDRQFWIRCLESCLGKTDKSVGINLMEEIYLGLDQHSSEDMEFIKNIFAQNYAVFICPDNKPMWVKASNCLWSSTVKNLRTKYIIAPFYTNYTNKRLEKFFKNSVGVDDLDKETLVSELEAFACSENKAQDHTYLMSILKALNEMLKYEKSISEALKQVRSKRIVPLIKIRQDGTKSYTVVSMDSNRLHWYVPDSVVYKQAFRGEVWLLDIEPEEVKGIEGLISAITGHYTPPKHECPAGLPVRSQNPWYLSHVVVGKDGHNGKVRECLDFTNMLRNRSKALIRISEANTANIPNQHTQTTIKPKLMVKYKKLMTPKVFATSGIQKTLSIHVFLNPSILKTISGKPTTPNVMLRDSTSEVQLFILDKHANSRSGLHSNFADELIKWLDIRNFKYQRCVDQVLGADNHDQIRDILMAAEINVNDLGRPHENVKKVADRPESVSCVLALGSASAAQDKSTTQSQGCGNVVPSKYQTCGLSRQAPPERLDTIRQTFLRKAPLTQPKRPSFDSRSSRTSSSDEGTTLQTNLPTDLSDLLQMSVHTFPTDPKSGLEGEFIVFNKLKDVLGPTCSFSYKNWTSEIRHLADSSIPEWHAADEKSFFADFTYQDNSSKLGVWMNDKYPSASSKAWSTRTDLTYHIEVKATFGASNEPFHISCWQFTEALRKSPNRPNSGNHVFLLFRVSQLQSKEPCLEVFDVYSRILDGTMLMGGEGLLLQSA